MKGALIGCGFFAQNQLHAWRDIEGVDIVALCDNDVERLHKTAQSFGVTQSFTDAADLFAKGGFDFVENMKDVHAMVAVANTAG